MNDQQPQKVNKISDNAQAIQGCAGCGCLTLLVASILGGVLTYCSADDPKRAVNMSFIQCQSYVKDKLKSPSTAKFPLLDFTVSQAGEDVYIVRSYVDAQNSFGAMLRSSFTCSIKRVSKNSNMADPRSWRLNDLVID